MPFKKYQSLRGRNTRNTRLSVTRFGRRWTPQGAFWAFGLRADSGTPYWGLARGVLSRARLLAVVIVFCWSRQQWISLLRMMPMWSSGPASRSRGVVAAWRHWRHGILDVRTGSATMKSEALWLRLHCLSLILPSPLIFPQELVDGVRIAFFSRPEVPDVGQAPDHEIGGLVDLTNASVS